MYTSLYMCTYMYKYFFSVDLFCIVTYPCCCSGSNFYHMGKMRDEGIAMLFPAYTYCIILRTLNFPLMPSTMSCMLNTGR